MVLLVFNVNNTIQHIHMEKNARKLLHEKNKKQQLTFTSPK
jgi:hypothetical protein